jgi:hypothetical protein
MAQDTKDVNHMIEPIEIYRITRCCRVVNHLHPDFTVKKEISNN